MAIKGIDFNDNNIKLLEQIVQAIPQNDLITFLASRGSKSENQRVLKRNVMVLQVMNLIRSKEQISERLQKLLRKNFKEAAALFVLSEAIIRERASDFARVFGEDVFRLAVAIDGRIEEPLTIMPVEEELSKCRLNGIFAPLAALHSGDIGTGVNFKQAQQITALQEELAKLRSNGERLPKEQQKVKALDAEVVKLRKCLDDVSAERNSLRNRTEAAEAKLRFRLENDEKFTDLHIKTRIAEEFSELLGANRYELVLAGSDLENDANKEAEEKLLEAIQKQEKKDAIAGTRRKIEERLTHLKTLQEKARRLLYDAISPLPELGEALRNIQPEIEKMEEVLGKQKGSGNESVLRLIEAIKGCPERNIPDYIHIAKSLNKLTLVSDCELQDILSEINLRYSSLCAKRGLSSEETSTPTGALSAALNHQMPLRLYIDGHNTLYGLASRYVGPMDYGKPPACAREYLISDICYIARQAPNLVVTLTFDGIDYSEEMKQANVRVVYAPGGIAKEHRADDLILNELKILRHSNPSARVIVITNDNGFAASAAQLGAQNLPPTSLLTYFPY